jgi:hypothetical protein
MAIEGDDSVERFDGVRDRAESRQLEERLEGCQEWLDNGEAGRVVFDQ